MTGDNHRGERRGARLIQWLRGFAHQTRGNVAMMFGMALPLLLMVGLGAIDIHQASRVKANLQDALDAAALVAARSSHTTAEAIEQVGLDALKANMPDYYKGNAGDTASFVLQDNVLKARAQVNVKVLVANIILPPYGKLLDDYLPVSTSSEVLRASRNVEVGMALDITESMKGGKLDALKLAAKDLVDIVVQEPQGAFYSRIGLVPYASGVNLGADWATAARGPELKSKNISSVTWGGDNMTVTGVTKEVVAKVTVTNNTLKVGDTIYLSNLNRFTSLNSKVYRVLSSSGNVITVAEKGKSAAINTSSLSGNAPNTGRINKCHNSDCDLVLQVNNHEFKDNFLVHISSLAGNTTLNNNTYNIYDVSSNSFAIDVFGPGSVTFTKDTGKVQCYEMGCTVFQFTARDNNTKRFNISNCVSERVTSARYTDAAPTPNNYFGHNYPSAKAACPSSTVMALSSSRTDLKKHIEDLVVDGTTGGQIGIAWAWNMVSPNFDSFWDASGAFERDHDPEKTLKVVVLMTDGEFNTNYCNGVLASDADIRSYVGDASTIKNCNSPNGHPFAQSVSLCDAMKASGVIVYTVGFELGSGRGKAGVDTAIEVMESCATTIANHHKTATTTAELQDAFRAIGRDITRLRIAR